MIDSMLSMPLDWLDWNDVALHVTGVQQGWPT